MRFRVCQWPNDLTPGVRVSQCGMCGMIVVDGKPYCAEHLRLSKRGHGVKDMQAFRITAIEVGLTDASSTKIYGQDTLDRPVKHELTPEQFKQFEATGLQKGDWVTHDRETGEFKKAEIEKDAQ